MNAVLHHAAALELPPFYAESADLIVACRFGADRSPAVSILSTKAGNGLLLRSDLLRLMGANSLAHLEARILQDLKDSGEIDDLLRERARQIEEAF